MFRLLFRFIILIWLASSLLIGVTQWLGQRLSGDVFLYLTQVRDDERHAILYAFDSRTGITQAILKQIDIVEFTVSPDGQFLLYAKRENRETTLYRYNLRSGQAEAMLRGNIDTPRWSPDGQWIAYRNTQGRERGLYILSLNTGEIRRITNHPQGVYSWSDDSQMLIYATAYESDYGIFSISIEDNERNLLSTFEGYMTGIDGFPVLVVTSAIPEHYEFISGKSDRIGDRMIFSGHPTWSSDDEKWAYVYVSSGRRYWGLHIYNAKGDVLARYQPKGLVPRSSLIWWLSR